MKFVQKNIIYCTPKQKTKFLGCSDSTNKRYRNDTNVNSPNNIKSKKRKNSQPYSLSPTNVNPCSTNHCDSNTLVSFGKGRFAERAKSKTVKILKVFRIEIPKNDKIF